MKWNVVSISLVAIICGALFVSADFAPPTKLPPEGNTAPPINTGNITQIKRGSIGIQLSPSPLQIPSGAGLFTDAAIGVRHSKYTTSNSGWKMNANSFALDTNAPISVNGLFSAGPIRSETSITGKSLSADSLKITDQPGGSRQLCASTSDGVLSPCTNAIGSQLQVSILATPQSVLPNSNKSITISWQATPSASSCVALAGDGFSTGNSIMGNDVAAPLNLISGETAQYVIACSDTYGNTKIAATEVVAQERPPIITFSVNPPIGSWSSGAFFTTGVTLNPNGGGVMNCRKKVDGMTVSPTNGWSGQPAGIWSSTTSVPPGNSQSLNTCYDGCQFKDIVTEPESSALLTLQCSNSSATTTQSRWVSVSE